MLRIRQEESRQISLVDLLLPPEVLELPEDLAKLDAWLDDERFFTPFRDKYHQCLGRPSVPAETYLRMTALKHQYGLSDRHLCALVSDRISWHQIFRIPWNKPVPHPSSLSKIRQRLDASGSDHMAELNAHLVCKAQEERLLKNRNKVRLTESAERLVTEYDVMIGNPPDKELLVPGVREHIQRTGRVPQATATDRGFWAPAGDSRFKGNGCAKSQPSF